MASSKTIPVGIDLGTTFSVLAHLDAEGRPWTVRNAEGDTTTPSVAHFSAGALIVGKEAAKLAAFEPDQVAICAKRDMGEPAYSKPLAGCKLPPEVIAACVLRKLKRDAEQVIGPIEKVVVTVPAYFNEPRRKATQDAGRIAGLDVIDIINEPTAAAVAFGVQRGLLGPDKQAERERLLVFDLGGGTFDVTLMDIEGKDFKTVGTGGDVFLGGGDWDRRLADYLCEVYAAKHGGVELRDDAAAYARLLREAEEAKRTLSARDEATIAFEHDGARIRQAVSRAKLEDLTRELVERTRFTSTRVLREAGCKWSDLSRVLVVGGATRMPMITEMLERELGRPVDRSLSPDEAVAHGAALYAGLLLSGAQPTASVHSIKNVNSHNLSVLAVDKATGRPRARVMIARNTPLQAEHRARFATSQANQRSVVVQVIEGGDASGNNSTPIGRCVVSDLPPGLPIHAPVDVTFKYAENGRLIVEARVEGGASATTSIERASGLSEEAIRDWQDKLERGELLTLPAESESAALLEEGAEPAAESPAGESLDEFNFDFSNLKKEPAKGSTPKSAPKGKEKPHPDKEEPDLDDFFKSLG